VSSQLSQLDTHIAEVLAGVTLSVNAFECWHARGPSRLVKDLTCAAAGLCGTHRFCLWAALFWTMKIYVQVSRDDRLHKTQTVLAETSCPR